MTSRIKIVFVVGILLGRLGAARAGPGAMSGVASWYGEEHRGKLMADGRPFNPDKLTAASWYYPLGTRVRVTVNPRSPRQRSVVVTITDRGPARRLVRNGRIVDLAHAAFRRVAQPANGLVAVVVEPIH